VILGGAASSADLGCSSEYSTADLSDISLKAEVGKGFVSTAIGHESLGTKPNVGPHLWNGMIGPPVRWGNHIQLGKSKAGLTFLQLTTGSSAATHFRQWR